MYFVEININYYLFNKKYINNLQICFNKHKTLICHCEILFDQHGRTNNLICSICPEFDSGIYY
jgi:hypothetical protein